MSAEAATLAGRQAAEALMLDSCIITRGGVATWDEDSATWTDGAATTVYTGPCKVQTRDVQVANPQVAGSEGTLVSWSVHLPIAGSGDVRTNDKVRVTAATLDAELVGKVFTVTGPHVGTAKTARRLPVRAEVSSWT